jgi:DNA-binding response OmpR family regulator|tara:strand:- start:309 stop:686 length:378 start_codon:yes stop_codon:yes gene_type:complete
MAVKKVLLVEDNPVILISLEFLMKQNGYDVLTADNGDDALNLAEMHLPDLIMLDVMLNTSSGFEICRTLRTRENMGHAKIILLSALGQTEDIEKGIEAGADLYVTKPFSTRDLVKTVKEMLADEE